MNSNRRERSRRPRIPQAAIRRLPVYLRELEEAVSGEERVVSSAELSARTGFTSEQIRKDLAYFGAFGTRGVGYDARLLASQIKRILGLTHSVGAAMIGAGHLGTALARFSQAEHKDIRIRHIFDKDPAKVGSSINGVVVEPVSTMLESLRASGVRIAVIAVPETDARTVFAELLAAGVMAVLNFSPVKLAADGVHVQNIDLTMELESLAYYAQEGVDR